MNFGPSFKYIQGRISTVHAHTDNACINGSWLGREKPHTTNFLMVDRTTILSEKTLMIQEVPTWTAIHSNQGSFDIKRFCRCFFILKSSWGRDFGATKLVLCFIFFLLLLLECTLSQYWLYQPIKLYCWTNSISVLLGHLLFLQFF